MFPSATKLGGSTIAFPDVCKTPAPPGPFAPIPYPNIQYQENLKKANRADAKAASGNKKSKRTVNKVIKSLQAQTGIKASSATQAVMIGKTMNERSQSGVVVVVPSQTRVILLP